MESEGTDMVSMKMSLIATGEDFSPSALEIALGIQLAKKHEKGDLGNAGRYKNLKYPFGSCIIEMPNGNDLIGFLETNMSELLKYGITQMIFEISIEYLDQCNFDFTPEWLARISMLNIPVSISCYKAENNVQ
jgi:hypothetical protein